MPEHLDADFTVDTGLFRQLGELLVGRDSTALAELIKNAYDADATEVVLAGRHLDDPQRAQFIIADNGIGMTLEQLRRGFLRIAASGKAQGQRRSPVYRRRYTGEKGVGRLAAHKLAGEIVVTSVARVDKEGEPAPLSKSAQGEPNVDLRMLAEARIDWDRIEEFETLAEVTRGLSVSSGPAPTHAEIGTRLELNRLRHPWTDRDIRDVVRQLENFEPPRDLVGHLPHRVVPAPVLFDEPTVRDSERQDPGMRVTLEGEIDRGGDYWGSLLRDAEWVLEIRAERGRPIKYALAPTTKLRRENPHARPLAAERPHPNSTTGPFFDARILLRTGKPPTSEENWSANNSGVRIFLEGFRVLPYGEPRNDWLSLDADYTRRSGRLELDPLLTSEDGELSGVRAVASRDVSLRLLSNRAFFGAVFLTDDGSGGLKTLVNREGFVPDAHYDRLVELVQIGVRLLLRRRAHANLIQKRATDVSVPVGIINTVADISEGAPSVSSMTAGQPSQPSLPPSANDHDTSDHEDLPAARNLFTEDSRREGAAARLSRALSALEDYLAMQKSSDAPLMSAATGHGLEIRVRAVRDAATDLIEDASLLRVLASVGTQLAAFTHELGQLVPTAVLAERALAPGAEGSPTSRLSAARGAVEELRRALERQAAYLVDVGSSDARRRRSRQPLHERVEATFLAFAATAAALGIQLENRVDANLKTPPMFRSEVHAILTNLISNAIKAAGTDGRVAVSASGGGPRPAARESRGIRILVNNTGIAVRPTDSERWFTPYESTSTSVDPALGQGMGLGLPITRDLLAEYGGSIRFVAPSEGFATSVEVVIPE